MSKKFSLFLKYKELLILIAILFIGLILRLILAPTGYHVDIFSNAGWGYWIWENGPLGFYENNVWVYSWPTQPPLVSLLYAQSYSLYKDILYWLVYSGQFIAKYRLAPTAFYWLYDFTNWFDDSLTSEIGFANGYLISIKLFAIFADIIIAIIIYYFAKAFDARNKLIWPAIFLFSPFSIYLSSIWGQYDQIGFLFLILSFLSLKKAFLISPLMFALSLSLKPTSLIFVPIYLYFVYLRRPSVRQIIISGLIASAVVIKSIEVFADKNWLEFLLNDLYRIIFQKSEFRVSTNSFNFWHILIGNKAINHNDLFLFMPYKFWGYLSVLLINIYAIRKIKILNFYNYAFALFLIGMGSWLFMTNMLERYIFAGIIGGLLLSIKNKKLIKYWLILSVIFLVNLYNGWWFPEWIGLKTLLEYQNGILSKILSLLNVIIFFIIIYSEATKSKKGQHR